MIAFVKVKVTVGLSRGLAQRQVLAVVSHDVFDSATTTTTKFAYPSNQVGGATQASPRSALLRVIARNRSRSLWRDDDDVRLLT